MIEGGLPKRTIGLTEPELLSIMYDSDNELTKNEADSILSDFMLNEYGTSSQLPFRLISKEEIPFSEANIRSDVLKDHIIFYDYEISTNMPSKGKAIICGDKRFPAVLAFIDSYKAEVESSNIMLELSKSYAI